VFLFFCSARPVFKTQASFFVFKKAVSRWWELGQGCSGTAGGPRHRGAFPFRRVQKLPPGKGGVLNSIGLGGGEPISPPNPRGWAGCGRELCKKTKRWVCG